MMDQHSDATRRIVIISGHSGSGKSVALQALEDVGYYCIDNLPLALLSEFAAQLVQPKSRFARAAVSIDSRNLDIEQVQDHIHLLEDAGIEQQVLFLSTNKPILVKRYSETRRKHPLSNAHTSLVEAIEKEAEILSLLRERADRVVDTSKLTPHELREQVRLFASSETQGLQLLVESFGFKHGVPVDADYVFDVRCLPNPHWDEALRPYSGLDQPIIDFLGDDELVKAMRDDIVAFVRTWFPRFADENRHYLTVAIGCTGGRHRSVFTAESVAWYLMEAGMHVQVQHRDLVSAH